MKELLVLGGGLLLCSAICLAGPFIAIAEMHEVVSHPVQRCGPRCVIETFVFDNELEASVVAKKNSALVYELKGSPGKWFVDTMLTEAEAGQLE